MQNRGDSYEPIIRRVFHFNSLDDAEWEDEETVVFHFADVGSTEETRDYWHIKGSVFDIPQEVYIGFDIPLEQKTFGVGYDRRTSVMKKLSQMVSLDQKEIVIGGSREDAIPAEDFEELLRRFPTTAVLEHYGETLVEGIVQDYLNLRRDYAEQYEKSRMRKWGNMLEDSRLGFSAVNQLRLETIDETYKALIGLLEKGEEVVEETWQKGILGILPTLFPQYVAVLPKPTIKDVLKSTEREADFLLVDARGNVDVLEIKRAFGKKNLLMKSPYRDNYVPARELSGGIAQIEKYIHLLLNWGPEGERELTKDAAGKLSDRLRIRFLHPRGLLLIGHCVLTDDDQRAFDLIRRQYSHVADVITYDDLIDRLGRMRDSLAREIAEHG